VLGVLAGSVFRIRRAHVEAAMRRAQLAEVAACARAMYASLGTAVFEFLWIAGRRTVPRHATTLGVRVHAALREHGRAPGPRQITGAPRPPDAPTRGLVIATAHTGNWDFVACALGQERIHLSVVTKRLSLSWLDRFWQERRRSFGVELIHGRGAFAGAVDAVERGRAVGVMIDQVPERRSAVSYLGFLGAPARCDTMPALLAARTGAPLLLALGRRTRDGRHAVDLRLRLDPPARPGRRWVEEATRALNAALEDFIREEPAQWLWLHRRWKDVPPGRHEAKTAQVLDGDCARTAMMLLVHENPRAGGGDMPGLADHVGAGHRARRD
jgi:KDO2-lipid IV(A) lauroyltransferase